ncbi:MAG: DnaB helicase C-terminal domain-containing protein [Oscillospiraceae bacterium]|nr:DnaB helicase C-terminal domain-containing protein [Oscillospiraceae bacterium]
MTHIKDYIQSKLPDAKDLTRFTGLFTGIADLDQRGFTLNPGEITLVAARPSMGCTALLTHIALRCGIQQSAQTAFFSLDLPIKLLTARMVSAMAGVPYWQAVSAEISADAEKALNDAFQELLSAKLYIDDRKIITVQEIREACAAINRTAGLDLLIIDAFPLVKHERNKKGVEQLMEGLRAICTDLNIPVVITAWLDKLVEKRAGHRPTIYDLGRYEALVNIVDNIILMFREVYYKPETKNPDLCELILAKAKEHPHLTALTNFISKTGKFGNILPLSEPKKEIGLHG